MPATDRRTLAKASRPHHARRSQAREGVASETSHPRKNLRARSVRPATPAEIASAVPSFVARARKKRARHDDALEYGRSRRLLLDGERHGELRLLPFDLEHAAHAARRSVFNRD